MKKKDRVFLFCYHHPSFSKKMASVQRSFKDVKKMLNSDKIKL